MLIEECVRRGLDDDILGWVACGKFSVCFGIEVVLCVLCFPVAVGEFEGIDDFAVWRYPSFFGCVVCFLAEECEVGLVAVVLQEALECGADGAFVLFAEPFVRFEFGVVVFDGFMRGFDVEHSGCGLWVMGFGLWVTACLNRGLHG